MLRVIKRLQDQLPCRNALPG